MDGSANKVSVIKLEYQDENSVSVAEDFKPETIPVFHDKNDDIFVHETFGNNTCQTLPKPSSEPTTKSGKSLSHGYQKHNNRKSHKCEICSKEFYNLSKLISNFHSFHVVDKPFECQHCSKTFMKENQLAKHVKLHESKNQFSCDLCPKRCSDKCNSFSHLKHIHHRFFFCRKCVKSFESKADFDEHLNTVPETETKTYSDPKFKCEICNESFKSQCSLNIHRKCHSVAIKTEKNQSIQSNTVGELSDEFQCDLCPKTFDCTLNLVLHRKNAHGNAEWKCKVCLKTFQQRCRMKNHENIVHGTSKSFKCNICETTFKKQQSLNKHKQAHLEINRYKCDICGTTFKWQDQLDRHKQTHLKQNRYKCQICSNSFAQSVKLKVHIANYHGGEKPFKCHLCSKSWPFNSGLQKHLKSHTTEKSFKCDMCTSSYKYCHNLNQHKQKVHYNPQK